MSITVEQIKAARVLLGWSQEGLAAEADVNTRTVGNIEVGRGRPSARTIDMLQRAIESAGVIFVEENGEGPGVRLRKRK
jgi:DNA-binding XRE family transcriptional regulator